MKPVIFLYLILIIFFQVVYSEQLKLEIEGEAAILINADSGVILFEKNAYQLQYPASTTKIATALYALKSQRKQLDDIIIADQEALASISPEAKRKANYNLPAYWQETDGHHIGIQKGEEFTFHDLLGGMLVCSGNDAANVIAQGIGGTIPQFMAELNVFLKELGCQQTYFCNPHGLHHPQHQTTAYDLALLTQEALKNSVFRELVLQPHFMRPKTNKQKAKIFAQTNRLLRPGKLYYSKAIGVKTGYHSKAKHAFVGAARMGERTLIAVLLGCQNRNQMFQDSIKLFDAAFNQPKVRRIVLTAGIQKFTQKISCANKELKTHTQEDLSLEYYPSEDPQVKCLLFWNAFNLPIQKDQKIGELQLITVQGEKKASIPLLALEAIQLTWPYNWLANFQDIFRLHPFILLIGLIVSLAVCLTAAWILMKKV